jgi:hypothetical protein
MSPARIMGWSLAWAVVAVLGSAAAVAMVMAAMWIGAFVQWVFR